MRPIIPNEISDMIDKIYPYLQSGDGKGFVLSPDAPPEIVEMKEKIDKWNAELDREF